MPPGDSEHYRHIFDQVANLLRLTDAELATRAYATRSTINAKRKGASAIKPKDLFMLASALDLPIEIFFEPTVEAAILYALDRKTFDKESSQFRCTGRAFCLRNSVGR